MRDTFEVSISVTIAKKKDMGYGPAEQIGYSESFDIPAIGWAEVAKILGNLNRSVGSIKAKYPVVAGVDY